MNCFTNEWGASLEHVDETGDHQRTDEHHGDMEHRASTSGACDDDQQTDRIGERKRAEVPRSMRHVAVHVGREKVRRGQQNDLSRDECEQPPGDERAGAAILRSGRVRNGSAETRDRRCSADAGATSEIVDL
ncbi:MAG: hypothetical protein R2715_25420 [Ilumatobacteraceae bacterium]